MLQDTSAIEKGTCVPVGAGSFVIESIFVGFSILTRGHAGFLLEQSNERGGVGVANLGYDFLYVGIRFPQKLHGFFHLDVGYVIRNADAGKFTEDIAHARLGDGKVLINGTDLEIIGEAMLLNVFHKLGAKVGFGRDRFCCTDRILNDSLQGGEKFVDVIVVR